MDDDDCNLSIMFDHGIRTPEDLALLYDDDIQSLCSALRRPGGVDNNGNANRGFLVPLKGQMLLKDAAWFCRFMLICHQTLVPEDITAESVAPFKLFRSTLSAWTDPTDFPKPNDRDWAKCFEALREFFRTINGKDGVPLSAILKEDDDLSKIPSGTVYGELCIELEARVSITWCKENGFSALLWTWLDKIFSSHYSYTHIKPYQKNKDGRSAWIALTTMYLGYDSVSSQSLHYENKLKTLRFSRDTARSTLSSVLTEFVGALTCLRNLVPLGYNMMDEGTQV
jgi:hypothetical protein